VDPQVSLPGGGKGSLFDALEDQDASACVATCQAIAAANGPKNSAFVFVKPHAVTEATKDLVKKGLVDAGLTITSEGSLTAEEIDSKKLIDQHYYAIASKATILKPSELNVPSDKFEAQFGMSWEAALATGNVYNAMDACAQLGISADEMDAQWGICKKAKKLVKFGGGFYCGLIELEGKTPLYVFNGFFMSMRSKFTAPGVSIYYFTVEWDAASLSWSDFRGQLLGPTDPAECPAGSLRGQIKAQWQALGLKAEPDVGDNGVHASASPFEALAERMNWCGASLEKDPFGAALLSAGVPAASATAWTVDPQVSLPGGGKGSLFDALEDQDASACVATCQAIAASN
jgi:nucleoside diphosphate kinase